MGDKCFEERIQDSVKTKASIINRSSDIFNMPRIYENRCSSPRSSRTDQQISYRTSTEQSRILQPPLCSPQSFGGLETSDRPEYSQQICDLQSVQDGNTQIRLGGNTSWTMDDISGLNRRVLSHSNPQGLQTPTEVFTHGPGLAIQGNSVRPVNQPIRLHSSDATNNSVRSSTCSTSSLLPRRLVFQPGLGNGGKGSDPLASPTSYSSRPEDKSDQVKSYSHSTNDIFGNTDKYQVGLSSPFRRPNYEVCEPGSNLQVSRTTSGFSMATSVGTHHISGKTGTRWQDTDQNPSMATKITLDTKSVPSILPSPSRFAVSSTFGLVDKLDQSHQRDSSRTNGDEILSILRRIDDRLRSPLRPTDSQRSVVRGAENSPHKCPRTPNSVDRSETFSTQVTELYGSGHDRQYLDSGLLKQPRRHKITSDVSTSRENSNLGRTTTHLDIVSTHTRTSECSSGQSKPSRSSDSFGMVPSFTSVPSDLSNLDEASGGFVCAGKQCSTPHIHVTNSTTISMESGCSNPQLGRSDSLCISPNLSSKSLPKQSLDRGRDLDPDSTMLAQPGMVCRHSQPVHIGTITSASNSSSTAPDILQVSPSKSNSPVASRMATLKRQIQKRGFSEEVSSRIAQPHRDSTSSIYDSKWSIFVDWCNTRSINPINPSTPEIADFLLFLFDKKLAMSTIKGYRAAIGHILASHGRNISDDPDLSRLCKSLTKDRPTLPRSFPRWDLQFVLLSLTKEPYEPMLEASLNYVTQKTVFLLTLASAKRVSEVHAFSSEVLFSPDFSQATLDFIPGFMSKTHRADNPSTALDPVIIPALAPTLSPDLPDVTLCPVRALRLYLRLTSHKRLKRHSRLFVAYKEGHQGDIRKTTLAGWSKAVIQSAYMQASVDHAKMANIPKLEQRELRAFGATLAYEQHHSLLEVMRAAQWRSAGTFSSHYFRDAPSTTEGLSSLGPIVAGQVIVQTSRLNPPNASRSGYSSLRKESKAPSSGKSRKKISRPT